MKVRNVLAAGAFAFAGVCLLAALAMSLIVYPKMRSYGLSPGGALEDLQAWLVTGGGLAGILAALTKYFPQLRLLNSLVPAATNSIDTSDVVLIKAALQKHQGDKPTADALTTAGRLALDTLKEATFPITSVLLIACLFIAGCASGPMAVPIDSGRPTETRTPIDAFDHGACAEALAKQAELANQSPAFEASELLDGILTQGTQCGIPDEFASRVRSACSAIGSKPPKDLTPDQVAIIRSVR